MEWASTLEYLTLRGSKYIFLLVEESRLKGELEKALDQHFEEFGKKGGLEVRAVRTPEENYDDVRRELLKKAWPKEIRDRMREEAPYLVILKSDFVGFDPQEDEWRIVWLGSAKTERRSIHSLLKAFMGGIKRKEDLFKWLDERTKASGLSDFGAVNSPRALDTANRVRKVGRPGIFDLEFGIRETIDRMISQGKVPPIKHGWQAEFVRRLVKENPVLAGEFQEDSIGGQLARSGEFRRIKEAIQSGQDQAKTR